MAGEKRIRIEAPEKIIFTYRYAEPGSRIGAYILDVAIQVIVMILVGLLIYAFMQNNVRFSDSFSESFGLLSYGFFYLLHFFFQWFYFLLFEAFWNGRTPGKRIMKIRVIKQNGDALDFATLLLRNFIRAVDGFPALHVLGGIVSIIDRSNRRIGDMLAQTIVVYENRKSAEVPDFSVPFSILHLDLKEIHRIREKRSLDEKDLYVIRRYFRERSRIPAERKSGVRARLVGEVIKKLELDETFVRDKYGDDEKILITVYSAHAKEDSN